MPSAQWVRALDALLKQAHLVAGRNGLELIVERSGGSEARYLHVRREDVWFGVRIAAHFPFYACSQDYYQILLEDPPAAHATQHSLQQLEELITSNRQVVASPIEVESHLQHLASENLSLHQVASLRHRLNQRAKWAWEVSCREATAEDYDF